MVGRRQLATSQGRRGIRSGGRQLEGRGERIHESDWKIVTEMQFSLVVVVVVVVSTEAGTDTIMLENSAL